MKHLFLAAGLLLAASALPAQAQVGVSINIGDPNFYGRIDIGDVPQPRVIYAQPRVIERVNVVEEPVYVRVPPGHRKHWEEHCREYDACNRPVYFVSDDWYHNTYVPQYRERHGGGHHDDNGDDEGDHDNGHGHGHGKHKHDD